MRPLGESERNDMKLQIIMNTNYTEAALEKMTDQQIIDLYKTRVEKA